MALKIQELSVPGVLLVTPDCFSDHRGFFMETHHQGKYGKSGLDATFVQDNHSHSDGPVLRGLHYQLTRPQGKLVYAVTGEIFDVAVDIRRGSPTFGRWAGAILSAENHRQIYVPEGFAHGFVVLSQAADVIYKCTDVYTPGDEYGVLWNDPALCIDWPVKQPVLSQKDLENKRLEEIPEDRLPQWRTPA